MPDTRAVRNVRLFPALRNAPSEEIPLMQRRVALEQDLRYARPTGVARVAPASESYDPARERSCTKKQFSYMFNTGSHALNPMSADGSCAKWPPAERTDLVSVEADFLHPCVYCCH